jgi:pullulanase/glycogen debranching enzyme
MNSYMVESMRAGTPAPLGASCHDDGVNFALYSAHAERVELCLFDELRFPNAATVYGMGSYPDCVPDRNTDTGFTARMRLRPAIVSTPTSF